MGECLCVRMCEIWAAGHRSGTRNLEHRTIHSFANKSNRLVMRDAISAKCAASGLAHASRSEVVCMCLLCGPYMTIHNRPDDCRLTRASLLKIWDDKGRYIQLVVRLMCFFSACAPKNFNRRELNWLCTILIDRVELNGDLDERCNSFNMRAVG